MRRALSHRRRLSASWALSAISRLGVRPPPRAVAEPCGYRRYCLASARRRLVGRHYRPGHGFSRCARRASGQPPASTPPFSACSRAVRLHVGAVQAEFEATHRRRLSPRTGAAQTRSRPPVEAIVDGDRRTLGRRHIVPAAASPEHAQDAADHPTVIHIPPSCPTTCATILLRGKSNATEGQVPPQVVLSCFRLIRGDDACTVNNQWSAWITRRMLWGR